MKEKPNKTVKSNEYNSESQARKFQYTQNEPLESDKKYDDKACKERTKKKVDVQYWKWFELQSNS